jgi:hypothetical protein
MNMEIAPDVRRFILTSVPSVPFMEALLLLRSRPASTWQAGQLAARLYLPERQAVELLAGLAAAGVAAEPQPGVYTYGAGPELAALLDRVATAYSQHLVAVTDLIHSRVDKRAHQFADAFRLRKDTNP